MLCSVKDPRRAIDEIVRVLKPGGKFIFIEHVRARSLPLRIAQEVLNPFQIFLADGCHLTRDTASLVEERKNEFDNIHVENFTVDVGAGGSLISHQISGFACKTAAPEVM